MEPDGQSGGIVEEEFLTDIAKWKSRVGTLLPRRGEEAALIERASVMPTGRGVATVRIGRLDWELTLLSSHTGCCETKDDWMLVSVPKFKVAVRPLCGAPALQVYPQNDEVAFLGSQVLLPLSMQNLGLREGSTGTGVSIDNLDVDDELSKILLARFFDTKETPASSFRKKAEIIGENFSRPFLRCVHDLQTAKSISDVLETMLRLSSAYDLTQQALPQEQEAFDLTSDLYSEQVWEKDWARKNGSLWVRQQVNHAAMKCQTAAAATAAVAEVGAQVFVDLYTKPYEVPRAFQFKKEDIPSSDVAENLGDSEMNEYSDEVDPDSTASLPFRQDCLMDRPSSIFEELKSSETQQHWNSVDLGPGAANLDGPLLDSLGCSHFEIGDMADSNNPTGTLLRTNSFGSSWQSDFGNETSSESSWEVVRSQKNGSTVEDEADVLGAEISDAESLDFMLRGFDPFGKRDCSPLINEFYSLKLNSASCSADVSDPQEHTSSVQDEREAKVLERIASWSSSNSGSWIDHDIHSSASSVKKMRITPLETLAEEPAYNPEIARLYKSFVFLAAAQGNVLQWCSCKFNKLRCSIELKFQVGAFMEDDIATLSTGISRDSPLHVEIFLDSTNVRESLLKGDVRVSAHQGVPAGYRGSWDNTQATSTVLPPVAGLSCYIPHLVRQYLKQEVHIKRAGSGYEFPEGELITGLMQYVVAQLVFMRHTCCVCNHETPFDLLTSIVALPCEKNLCQALYSAWLVVTPRVVLELSTVEDWLKASFGNLSLCEAFMKHYGTHQDATWRETFQDNVERVLKWLGDEVSRSNTWLKLAKTEPKVDEEKETTRDSKIQAPKRRKTLLSDESKNRWASPPTSPVSNDLEQPHDFVFATGTYIGNWRLDEPPIMAHSPQAPEEFNIPGVVPHSLSKQKGEKAFTSAFSPYAASRLGQAELSSSRWREMDLEKSVESAGPPRRSPGPAREESGSQGWSWEKVLEGIEPLSLKEKAVASTELPRENSAQAQGGRSSFLDVWKVERRNLLPTLGKSRFREGRVPPQAPEEPSSSQGTRIRGESSVKHPVPPSREDLIDKD